jgi:hypothetical protein
MSNIIRYRLYAENAQLILIYSWFLANFENYEAFRMIVENHSELFQLDKETFNDFESDNDINQYAMSKENYTQTLTLCLERKLEDLAM